MRDIRGPSALTPRYASGSWTIIDEEAMYAVMKEMMRVTSKNIIILHQAWR